MMEALKKIKAILGFILMLTYFIFKISDLLSKGKFSEATPLLFNRFLHLNSLHIILIVGIVLSLIYLYNKFISPKRKLRATLKKAEKFNSVYGDFLEFIIRAYNKGLSRTKKDNEEYQFYKRKLQVLYSHIMFPLVKFLEEHYTADRSRSRAHRILGEIEECFTSRYLQEHFVKKSSIPDRNSYYKPVIQEFISYLRSNL